MVRSPLVWLGEADPVADNGNDAGRKQNRRVSVAFTPKGD